MSPQVVSWKNSITGWIPWLCRVSCCALWLNGVTGWTPHQVEPQAWIHSWTESWTVLHDQLDHFLCSCIRQDHLSGPLVNWDLQLYIDWGWKLFYAQWLVRFGRVTILVSWGHRLCSEIGQGHWLFLVIRQGCRLNSAARKGCWLGFTAGQFCRLASEATCLHCSGSLVIKG